MEKELIFGGCFLFLDLEYILELNSLTESQI